MFYEIVACLGIDKSEIMYTDEKKVSARRPGLCPPEGARTLGSPRGPERKCCQPGLHREAQEPAFKCPPHCRDS